MKNVIKFFKKSYVTDRTAFYAEIVETTLLIVASAVLSFTILDPATKIFVPMYLVGSVLGVVSAVIRQAAFVIVLCSWFVMMNTIALYQLFLM